MPGPGGKRRGAGRPNGSKDRADSARQWAAGLWKKHDCDKIVGKILAGKDNREKTPILIKLMEYQYGKPIQPISTPAEQPIEVRIVSSVPRPKR